MKLSLSALLLAAVATPAIAQTQLPDAVVPTAYDITITPDAKALTFSGSETVAVTAKRATKTIVLNVNELNVTNATFDGRRVPFKVDAEAQTLTVTLPAAAKPGAHRMTFAWTGKINTSALGLFAIDYTNTDGTPARMLATQFESPDARRFAPMWDEPAFKARFTLSTVAPKGQTAFSNMPAASVTKRADGSTLYRFGQSPVMSSYLLFLGMGDVERRTVMAGKTEIGVITRRGVADQSAYALEQAKRLLSYYNDYFGQPYPLPKLDMIAGPGSSLQFGAMENWGAIFYFENEVLFDPKRTTESGRQRIFSVIAHEMAHQWFGDLVTMKWWDDLWLNEGFASWMENKAAIDLHPEWDARASAVSGDREIGFALDATQSTHPVIRPVTDVNTLSEVFDVITYQKGQAVIDMLEGTLGPDHFRDGIRRYMARYKYGNTVTDHLWAELAAASGKPVADIARGFTLQPGIPLVSLTGARCVDGRTELTLTQTRFGYDAPSKRPLTWKVPLRLGVIGRPDSETVVSGPKAQTVTVAGCGTVVLNRGKQSYARMLYGDAEHAALVRDFVKLDLTDQLGTLQDDYALAVSGDQSLARYFDLLGAVPADAHPLVWSAVSGKLDGLAGMYDDTPIAAPLRARIVTLFGPVLAKLGIEPKAGETTLAATLRENLIRRLGAAGDPAVKAAAARYVAALATNPDAIPAAIRAPILSTYAANPTPAEWDALLALTRAETNPVSKNAYVDLLGSARDPALARRALSLLDGSMLTDPQKASLLGRIATRHPDMAFDYALAHLAAVRAFVEAGTWPAYIVQLGGASTDPAMPQRLRDYAKAHPETSTNALKRVLAGMELRKANAARLQPAVAAWLGQGG